ncbi:MAG TPA: hypothetical protein EYQ68_01110 [Cytophagales bacterium]|nr:hypothetical protein [Cytophagales bacterium]|tara:strand:+ start:4046 stop:4237 length:192 start_codon:yes stop_codon:yes gene_type:complete
MKNYIFFVLAVILLVLNFSKFNFQNIYSKDSKIALIGVLACACAILLLTILNFSKKIKNKTKN